jgi:xanthine dehydrogenase accessory factor
MKVGNIDPRGERGYVDTISDKARAIGGGVLEAILHSYPKLKNSRLTGAAKTNCKG